jgi:hypothetical protein
LGLRHFWLPCSDEKGPKKIKLCGDGTHGEHSLFKWLAHQNKLQIEVVSFRFKWP